MSYATDKWFSYLRNDVLTEGVRDIGLPEVVIDRIESTLPEATEKAKTWMGHQWKETSLHSIPVRGQEAGTTATDFGLKLLNTLSAYTDEDAWETPALQEAEETELTPEDKRKRVLFVIKDLAYAEGVVTKKPMGQWPRAFKKALKNLSKLGIPSEVVEKTREQFHFLFVMTFEQFARRYSEVFTLLNMDPTNFEYIKGENIDEAVNTAEDYIQNQENPDQIIHTFDDGSYWYDLQTSNCSIEAERMGHCGDSSYSESTLVSLRKKDSKQKESKSYVTMDYRQDNDTIYQIKGRSNTAPPEETWPHIKWFVDNAGVTNIEESGEHSNDDFDYMRDWLRENTSAQLDGGWEQKSAAMQDELDEILRAHDSEDYDVWAEVYDEDMGHGEVYYSAGGSLSLQINLGWPAMDVVEGEYVPMAPGGEELPDIERIPTENQWGAAREFMSESGIEDWGGDLPGEEEEFEYSVEMLEGYDPAWEMGDPSPPSTAHITIKVDSRQETSDDPGSFDYFATEIQSAAEDLKESAQKIRSKLVEGGFAIKTAFDTSRGEIEELEAELENWTVYNEGAEIEFWFNPEVNDEGGRYTIIPSGVDLPVEVFYYTDPSFRNVQKYFHSIWNYARASGGGAGKVNFSGDSLNQMMAKQLVAQDAAGKRAQHRAQQQLDFGADYRWKPTPLELARDIEFIVIPQINYFRDSGGISDIDISYRLTLRVDPNDSAEEIQKTINMVKYLNENPEQVQEAAHEIILLSVEPHIEKGEQTKKDMLDGSMARTLINAIDRRYGERAHNGDNEAEKATILARWAEANWGDMNPVEKTALLNTYLYPMSQGALSLHHLQLELELIDPSNPHSHPDDLGMPTGWESDVREELRYRGAAQQIRNKYKWTGTGVDIAQDAEINEPPELQENINLSEELPSWIETPERYEENQLGRVERLLEKLRDPDHDLRIYNIQVGCNLIDRVGGTDAEIAAQIRGIDGVTTVRPIADSKREITPTETFVLFDIKFELLGAQSRVEFRDALLIPQMRLIDGLKIINWTAIHKTNIQGTVRTVREARDSLNEQGFGSSFGYSMGGSASALGAIRAQGSGPRPTPTPTLDAIVQDWVEGGVQAYDFPTDANDMRYHTMMPVKELWQHHSKVQRHPKDIFDIKYQRFNATYQRLKDKLKDPKAYHEFIHQGANGPVYLAIGKNGRIKITGNEDLLWFAKKAGLEELPVFLSYQRQV